MTDMRYLRDKPQETDPAEIKEEIMNYPNFRISPRIITATVECHKELAFRMELETAALAQLPSQEAKLRAVELLDKWEKSVSWQISSWGCKEAYIDGQGSYI